MDVSQAGAAVAIEGPPKLTNGGVRRPWSSFIVREGYRFIVREAVRLMRWRN